MTRINLDSKFMFDARIDLLRSLVGMEIHAVRGRLIAVWFGCYEARSSRVRRDLVDASVGHVGFCESMIGADLAEVEPRYPDRVRIRGIEDRISFLLNLDQRAKKGGVNSARSRVVKAQNPTQAHGCDERNHTGCDERNPLTLSPDLDLPDLRNVVRGLTSAELELDEFNRPRQAPKRERRRVAKTQATEQARQSAMPVLRALGGYTGIAYSGASEHVRLITARMAEGLSALDLRKVAWYCADADGLGWASDPRMARYLRPETLYGPATIAKYLDAARTKYRVHFKTDDDVATSGEVSNG